MFSAKVSPTNFYERKSPLRDRRVPLVEGYYGPTIPYRRISAIELRTGRWSAVQRFWARVNADPGHGPNGDCWLWMGPKDSNGYGRIGCDNKVMLTHRFALELVIGKIPDRHFSCHKCDNPSCVRPDHLFCGTAADNSLDMVAKGRRGRRKPVTHCPAGHEFSSENTYHHKNGVRRNCRICAVKRTQEWRARNSNG